MHADKGGGLLGDGLNIPRGFTVQSWLELVNDPVAYLKYWEQDMKKRIERGFSPIKKPLAEAKTNPTRVHIYDLLVNKDAGTKTYEFVIPPKPDKKPLPTKPKRKYKPRIKELLEETDDEIRARAKIVAEKALKHFYARQNFKTR